MRKICCIWLCVNAFWSSTFTAHAEHPSIIWQSEPVGLLGQYNSPLIVGNQVFLSSSGRVWNRYDPIWQRNTEETWEQMISTPPCYPELQPHPTQPGDGIYAIDWHTGKTQWFVPLSADANALAWANGALIFSSGLGFDHSQVGAIDSTSGCLRWVYTQPGVADFFQPAIIEQQVVIGNNRGQLSAFDLESGILRWQRQFRGEIRSTPVWDHANLYIATTAGEVAALSHDGHILWQHTFTHPFPAYSERSDHFTLEFATTPKLLENTLYFSFARNTFYPHPAMVALDTATGKVRWWAQDPQKLLPQHANLRTSPAVWGDYLLIGTPYTPTALQINRHTGILTAVLPMGYPTIPQWPSPAMNGHQLILPRHDGYVYAWDVLQQKLQWRLYLGTPEEAGKTFPVTSQTPDWMPAYGDAIYTSPAIGPDGSILVGANGYLYRIGQK
jgi:outer membrane protein assembly factor BamB